MTTPVEPAAPVTPAAPEAPTPPWGDEKNFDPEKAWKLIEGLRADKEALSKRPVLTDEAAQQLAEFEKQKKANQSELEKANDLASNLQTRTEKLQRTAVATTVRALAADDFADPTDAVSALDPVKYLGLEDEIDEAAIKADLAALLDAKPHYRKPEGTTSAPRVPAPNAAQGKGANPVATSPADQFAATLRQAMAQQ